MTMSTKRTGVAGRMRLAVLAGVAMAGAMAAPAQAAYTVKLYDTANGIKAVGRGSINVDGLSDFGLAPTNVFLPQIGSFFLGEYLSSAVTFGAEDGFVGPEGFSSKVSSLMPVSATGRPVGLGNPGWTNYFIVPGDYKSGSDLGTSVTQYAAGTTVAGLELSANRFVYRFGSGANADTFTVRVANAAGAVPEPATWAMMIVGFGAVGGTMRRRKAGARLRLA